MCKKEEAEIEKQQTLDSKPKKDSSRKEQAHFTYEHKYKILSKILAN